MGINIKNICWLFNLLQSELNFFESWEVLSISKWSHWQLTEESRSAVGKVEVLQCRRWIWNSVGAARAWWGWWVCGWPACVWAAWWCCWCSCRESWSAAKRHRRPPPLPLSLPITVRMCLLQGRKFAPPPHYCAESLPITLFVLYAQAWVIDKWLWLMSDLLN